MSTMLDPEIQARQAFVDNWNKEQNRFKLRLAGITIDQSKRLIIVWKGYTEKEFFKAFTEFSKLFYEGVFELGFSGYCTLDPLNEELAKKIKEGFREASE